MKNTPQAFIDKHPVLSWISIGILSINFLFPSLRTKIEDKTRDFLIHDYELTYVPPDENKPISHLNLTFTLKNEGSEPIKILRKGIIKQFIGLKRVDTTIYETKQFIPRENRIIISDDIGPTCWYPYSSTDSIYTRLIKENNPLCEILVIVELRFSIGKEIIEKKV